MNISHDLGNQKFLVTDLGTTHIKSAVFDDCGHLLEILKSPTPESKDDFGTIYDPFIIYETVSGQIAYLLKHFDNVKGISVTGMSEAGLTISRNKKSEETPILPWYDLRTDMLAKQVDYDKEICNFYSTGLRNSYKYGIYKFLWQLNHYQLRKLDTIWLSACDYIVWKLTGRFVSDPTFAARTYVYDIIHHCWDKSRLAEYGLTVDNFPEIIPTGKTAGYLTDKFILSQTQKDPIPVCIGGHDHVCAAYAVFNDNTDRICDSMGTAETYLGIFDNKDFKLTAAHYESGLVYGPYINGKGYFWMANISSSGQSVEWFRKKVQKTEIIYDEMNGMLSALPKGPTDIIYYPYLSGIGTPLYRTDISGSFFGLNISHTAADMLKAILEGICFQGKWILSLVPGKQLEKIKDIICVGGAANSIPWMRLKADILGLPITVPKEAEAAMLGAAAIMIDSLYGAEKRKLFLTETQGQNQVIEINRGIHERYNEIYTKKYTFLINVIIGQELGRKE